MKRKNFICFCAIGTMAAFCTACGAETTEPVTVETIDWNQNNGEQEQVTAVETIPFSAMDSAEWESQDNMTSDGTIAGDEFVDKVIFDLYALEDDVPVQVFCSQERDRYYLCEEETGGYEIANAGSSGADLSAWHYYILNGQEMQVVQAIIYDGMTDPENPWYMAYDEDWDTTNDTSVDEKMAEDIIESYENQYMQPDYMSFAYYK